MKILTLLTLLAALALTSCATLNSIPFSLSYMDESGKSVTITKLAVPKVTPTK